METQIASNLSSPTALAFAPDGRAFITQQEGQILIVKNGILLPTPFATMTVDSGGERGLLGITFDPDFANNHYIYVYYASPTPTLHNRVSRLTANGDTMQSGSETVLVDFTDIGSAIWHMGGALHFGSDGKLYVVIGDHQNSANSQSLATVKGKILRFNSDGSIPNDNPFYNSTTGINRSIWALGLRNPFTFAVQPGTGRIYLNDVGESSWEEIDELVKGGNYGWPNTEGYTSDPAYISPVYSYSHSEGCSIIGGAFYNPPTTQFPAQYTGKYFFADFCSGWIRYLDPGDPKNTVNTFATGTSFPTGLQIAPDGSLWYLARGGQTGGVAPGQGKVFQITYTLNQAPSITLQPQSQTKSVGQSVTFTVTASGASPLNYQWQRNGVNIAGATSPDYTINSVTLSDNSAVFHCVVSNTYGSVTSNNATLNVISNQPPTPIIATPGAGTMYNAGDTISYSGSGTDPEQGNLPASALTWQVDFQHDTHSHPFIPPTSGISGGSFTIPRVGETSSNVWYRIYLTVTDAGGLSSTTYRDIFPRKATVTLDTNPSGLQIKLDGQPKTTPYTFVGVVGVTRTIEAVSPQIFNGKNYNFSSWSDGGANLHSINTPLSDTTYTANFTESTAAGVYVSDLAYTVNSNGWGPVEKDMSNGEQGSGDGRPITLNGTTYGKGLGVHAVSEILVGLNGQYDTFMSDVGVDDEVGANGSVVFQVWADGVLLYDSGVMTGNSPTKSVNVNISGKNQLKLVVNNGSDGIDYDHADWAGARLASGSISNMKYRWRFDEGTGLTTSDDVNGNTGTLINNPTWVAGISNSSALSFNGVDNFVRLSTGLTPILGSTATLSAWIKTSQTGNDTAWQAPGLTGVEQNGGVNDVFWGYIDSSGRIGIQAGDMQGAKSNNPINDNVWHNVVLTRDSVSGEVKVYIDGVLNNAGVSDAGNKITPFSSLGRVENTNGSALYFNGVIDDVRIYNRVLSASEVQQLNTAGSGFNAKINFQPLGSALVTGYQPDSGAVFGDRGNGLNYGWNLNNSDNTRERNAANSPDKRYDTLIHLQKPSNPDAVWEIAVPNGNYRVHVVSGDAVYFDEYFKTLVEGVLTVDGAPTTSSPWVEGTQTVSVTDGRLTIRSAPGAINNKICNVDINSVN